MITYTCRYDYTYICVYVHIYIYICREREICIYVYVHTTYIYIHTRIYIYIYIYIYTHVSSTLYHIIVCVVRCQHSIVEGQLVTVYYTILVTCYVVSYVIILS